MQYRKLGRTGLNISFMGMGTGGGDDPLGQKSGVSESDILHFLQFSYDQGINFFDTSPGYMESEVLLGKALKDIPRDKLVLSTKIPLATPDHIMNENDIISLVQKSLKRMQTDYIDVLWIAGTVVEHFDTVVQDHIPILNKLKEQGLIRFIGSSEWSRFDGAHAWLNLLVEEGVIDAVMVAHNMINQSAQRYVLPGVIKKQMGAVNIFTVRNLFWNQSYLEQVIADLKRRKVVLADALPENKPLDFLIKSGEVDTIPEAAYRYALHTPGITAVMCGSKTKKELLENINTYEKGPLSSGLRSRIDTLFGQVEEVVGN
jgi:L-galactose dehydrogenase